MMKYSEWQELCNRALREPAPDSIVEARKRVIARLQELSGLTENPHERRLLLSALHSLTVCEEYLAVTPALPQRIADRRAQSAGAERTKSVGAA